MKKTAANQPDVTQRATLTLLLFLLATGAGLFVLLAGNESVAPEGGTGENGDTPEHSSDAPVRVQAKPFPGESSRPALHDGITLRVLDDGQQALANAEVLFLATGKIEEALLREAMLLSGWDRIPVFERHGERLLTDARGEVRLPRFHDLASVAARHGALWSMLDLHQGMEGPVALVLRVSPALSVEVIDAEGKPAPFVPVVLRSRRGESILDLWRGESDGNGLVRVEHVAAVAQQDRLDGVLELAPGVPAAPEWARAVDLRALDRPLCLVAPPAGLLEVRVLTPEGAPAPRDTYVTLHGRRGAIGSITLPVVAGFARTSRALLGVALDIEAHALERWLPETATTTGPVDASLPCRVEVRLQRQRPAVVARLVDESGAPLCGPGLRVQILGRDRQHVRSAALKADASGVVRIELRAGDPAEALLRIFLQDAETGAQTASVDAVLPPERSPELDLGVLALRLLPALVEGVVTDGEGHGLEGLITVVEERRAGSVWKTVAEVLCATDRAGRFLIRGSRTEAELRVAVRHDRWRMAEPVPFRQGEVGVRLVLAKRASLAGQVLTDAAVDARLFEVNLEPEHGGTAVAMTTPAVDGRWLMQDVPRGSWRVVVAARGGHAEFARISGINVLSDVAEDARLACIDLRGQVRNVAINILDGEGAAVREAWVHLAGVRRGTWQRASDGRLEVLLGAEPVDIAAEAEGRGRAEARAVEQDTTLRLAHGHPVRIELVELPPAGTTLHARLVPANGRGFPLRPHAGGLSAPSFSGEGILETSVAGPGIWKLQLTLVRRGTDTAAGLPASAVDTIHVAEGMNLQSFRVRVAAQALLDAERQLQQRP